MPRVHVETAIGQFTGTRTLLATELERALDAEPAMRAEIETVRTAAYEAVDTHLDWLRSRLDDATGDPRLGEERFTRKLALALDTTTDADALLAGRRPISPRPRNSSRRPHPACGAVPAAPTSCDRCSTSWPPEPR
jgi:hypothetical protein